MTALLPNPGQKWPVHHFPPTRGFRHNTPASAGCLDMLQKKMHLSTQLGHCIYPRKASVEIGDRHMLG